VSFDVGSESLPKFGVVGTETDRESTVEEAETSAIDDRIKAADNPSFLKPFEVIAQELFAHPRLSSELRKGMPSTKIEGAQDGSFHGAQG
jgi:hypothetical protein